MYMLCVCYNSQDFATEANETFYTITYTDMSNNTCNSTTINSSSCEGGICRHMFDVSSSSCSNYTDIVINVFAINGSVYEIAVG